MELFIGIVAVVCVVVLTLVSGSVYNAVFPTRDDYKWFREEHLGMALFNSVVTAGVLALIFSTPVLPTLILGATTLGAWVVFRLVANRSPKPRSFWDKKDMAYLGASFAVGIVATFAVVGAAAVGALLWPVALFALCWAVLFPM